MTLWHLAALNPSLSPMQRDDLAAQLKDWHIVTIDKVRKARSTTMTTGAGAATVKKCDVEAFVGLKPAIEACQLDWCDYAISGVTYVERTRPLWRFPFTKTTQEGGGAAGGGSRSSRTKGVVTSQLGCGLGKMHCRPPGGSIATVPSTSGIVTITQEANNVVGGNHQRAEVDRSGQADGAYSSSSEGFCEIDKGDMIDSETRDSDSDLGDIGAAIYSHGGDAVAVSGNPQPPAAAAPAGSATDDDDPASAAGGAVANITLTETDDEPTPSSVDQSDRSDVAGCQGNKAATLAVEAAAAAVAAAESLTSGDEYQVSVGELFVSCLVLLEKLSLTRLFLLQFALFYPLVAGFHTAV